MSDRRDELLDLDELAELLRTHEGPPQVVPSRERKSGAGRPGRSRLVWAAVVAVALLAGSALGFGLASSLTPSGGAADPVAGLGFMPERGWNVARTRFEASPAQPSFAFAANVAFHRLDLSLSKRRDFSGTPHYTLQSLRPTGIVLVASFSLRGVHEPSDESFPRRSLPLRLRDAASSLHPSGPGGRYGHYELRAAVGEHNVIVTVYFGTSQPSRTQIVAAQRQLDRLVVGSTRARASIAERALPLQLSAAPSAEVGSQSRGFDRTFSCLPLATGGVRDLDLAVSPNRTDTFGRRFTAVIEARSGARLPTTSLVLARARAQTEHPGLAVNHPVRGAAGVFASRTRCRPVRTHVALSARGLPGPAVRWEKELDCPVRGRVLVRVRATLETPTTWRRIDDTYSGARNPVATAQLAVRSEKTGKPIAFMELDAKGGSKLWHSGACA